MSLVYKIHKYDEQKRKIWVLIFRVILGIIITFKGVIFLNNFQNLESLILHSKFRAWETFWIYYITIALLVGGLAIIVGIFTRVAILMQIPALAGAMIFINPGDHGFTLNGELILSIISLGILFYFLFKGPGEISMDNYLQNQEVQAPIS